MDFNSWIILFLVLCYIVVYVYICGIILFVLWILLFLDIKEYFFLLLKRLKFLLLSFWWSVNERFVKILYFNGVMKSLKKKVFLNKYIINVLLFF